MLQVSVPKQAVSPYIKLQALVYDILWRKVQKSDARSVSIHVCMQLCELVEERLQNVFRRAAGLSGSRETAGCFQPSRQLMRLVSVLLGELEQDWQQDAFGHTPSIAFRHLLPNYQNWVARLHH